MSRNLMDLFAEASEISGAGERAAFLEVACGGDVELRARVEKLLGAHEQVGTAKGFLGGPEGPDGSALPAAASWMVWITVRTAKSMLGKVHAAAEMASGIA